jgi:hypothetical protein
MGGTSNVVYYGARRRNSSPKQKNPAGHRTRMRPRTIEQEQIMSTKALFACVLVAFVAACAAKEEVVYVEEPVTAEPVFTSKYQ